MRNVTVQFPSGREVLGSYWGFLKHGGLVIGETAATKDLAEGDSIVLDVKIKSLKQSYRFAGRVVQRATARAFVAFNEGQDQEVMLNAAWADTHDVPQRKHRRYDGTSAAVDYVQIDAPDKVGHGRMIDVSPGGCRLRGDRPLPIGARVRVATMGIEIEGQVRWTTKANEMGIEFSRPELRVQKVLEALLGQGPMSISNSGR
jgi:hypothetical protein